MLDTRFSEDRDGISQGSAKQRMKPFPKPPGWGWGWGVTISPCPLPLSIFLAFLEQEQVCTDEDEDACDKEASPVATCAEQRGFAECFHLNNACVPATMGTTCCSEMKLRHLKTSLWIAFQS